MSMHRTTIVLLTHERPVFLRRALAYYSAIDAELLVLDSSAGSSAELCDGLDHTTYVHTPGLSFLDKTRAGLAHVDTPYLAFCGDDDYLVGEALNASADFLDAHHDYGLCRGYELMYVPDGQRVHYLLRDKKVMQDFASPAAGPRVLDFMGNFLPPYYAVTRVDLLREWYAIVPDGLCFEFQEFGHAFYLLARAKAIVLDRPYALREANVGTTDHGTDLYTSLRWASGAEGQRKHEFVEFLTATTEALGHTRSMAHDIVLAAFDELEACLGNLRSLHLREIFYTEWPALAERPNWRFHPEQFLEMPFYTPGFLAWLEPIDLQIRVVPASKLQLGNLAEALAMQATVVAEVRRHRHGLTQFRQVLEEALQPNPFHPEIAELLAQATRLPAHVAWHRRLVAATEPTRALLATR